MSRLSLMGLTLRACLMLFALAGSGDFASAQLVPVLPETPFNYSDVTLPNHFLVNRFPPGGGQNAVIDNDNTPADNPITDAGATLGRVLFYDRKLSANETTACASCHQQEFAFSDPNQLSVGFEGGLTRRRSMGLANARFYRSGKFFWDERADTLEEQVLMPIQDHVEMGLTLEQLVSIVESQSYYPPLFEDAFGDGEVTTDRISKALAQFVRSILSFTSRYDQGRALVNAPTAPFPNFTRQENDGKNLFMRPLPGTNASCIACHIGEAFVSPAVGPPGRTSDATNNGLDAESTIDFGVMEATENPADDFKFKVPSLRNIAARPPFMHDGRFATLEQVIGFYSNGIQNHPNLHPILRTPNGNPVRFNFNPGQRAALVAFLETLTDEPMMADEKYSNPFVFIPPSPAVEAVVINDGDAQRSRVTNLTVLFDQEVDATAEAFHVVDRGTQLAVGGLIVNETVIEGRSVFDITFGDDPGVVPRLVEPNCLVDGNFELQIVASEVTAVDDGPAMEGDVIFGDAEDHGLFSLFADSDGDRDVDGVDYGRFVATFFRTSSSPSFDPAFDYDGDGDVDGVDYSYFAANFFRAMPFE